MTGIYINNREIFVNKEFGILFLKLAACVKLGIYYFVCGCILHIYTHIYMWLHMCVCVCVCVSFTP